MDALKSLAGCRDDGNRGDPKGLTSQLPIYTLTDEVFSNMQGWTSGRKLSSNGGKSTHAVIRTPWTSEFASIFNDLDQWREGDHFMIHVCKRKHYVMSRQDFVVNRKKLPLLQVEEEKIL